MTSTIGFRVVQSPVMRESMSIALPNAVATPAGHDVAKTRTDRNFGNIAAGRSIPRDSVSRANSRRNDAQATSNQKVGRR
jgi:hypothetical protein